MTKQFLFLNTIPNKTVSLEAEKETTIVGLVTEGWEGTRHFIIDAARAHAKARCLFFILGKNTDNFAAKIEARHSAPQTTVKINLRAALTDNATCIIDGNCRVLPKAIDADTYFSHHTILLSDAAVAKTAPNLEINTDRVKAGHSASVGTIDEDQLFYLLSRGVSDTQARAMLVRGFFAKELEAVNDEKIKKLIRRAIDEILL